MSFLSLLPIYLLGNLHCAGMCGPLVMLLAKHPCRWWYFVGRLFAFSVAGLISAEIGIFLFSFLSLYHISSFFSLILGLWISSVGLCIFFRVRIPMPAWVAKKSTQLSTHFSHLLSQNSPSAIFVFGCSTILLPCGQTVVVFSMIALHCHPVHGLMQGALFALLTSPALIAAMHAAHIIFKNRTRYQLWMGISVVTVGLLALLRSLAELHLIPHCTLNPAAPPHCHIVIF